MIISASRRTDIPALYGEWFMNRVHAGWCLVPNPLNLKQISRVSLDPADVDAIVFWSKNPSTFLPHLEELDRLGFRYYFQFSLNAYPGALEPNIPGLDNRLATFHKLSQRLGPICVIWRYDPIIISNVTPAEFHRDKFTLIAEELRGMTNRVVISIVDFYQKTDRRLSHLEEEGFSFDRNAASSFPTTALLKDLAVIARRNEMEIFTCAEERDYSSIGIAPGRCIDDRLLQRIWSLNVRYKKDPTQREACLCMVSKDIGVNDTCIHGCPYCYSTRNYRLAVQRHSEHDPNLPILWGNSDMLSQVSKYEYSQGRLFR